MTVALAPAASPRRLTGVARLLPGVALSAAIGAVAYGLQIVETRLFEHPWIEGLVLAILIGAGLRLVWTPSSLWTPGVAFSAKTLLEVAVALLGATVSGAAVVALGPWLLLAIVGVVAVAIVGGYALGRAFGLPHAMALLVACGNAICGNSAIAAVAPVIEAEGEDVAAAIGFTAVLGVAVVLLVPAVGAMMGYDATRVGVLAGLTVYAVPQVLAAAAPAGLAAVQTGAVVKLVRVLMLGPVCLVLGLMRSKQSEAGRGPKLHQMAPWFILVFLVLMAVRSLGWLPEAILPPLQASVSALTLIAMAALGLMVDPRAVARAGPRVAAVAALSALLIGLLALAVIAFLPLG
ncbi:YeiH family protein [Brevundimonas sp. 357]|uniref:YeiH family protein n=1 Tax=Brevundimonas sp. 357 TaxID=2555782 RepID=UPI000F7A3897|nr:putative sulfate exporter family transporter [Brevundimonas sp. 357]RSB47995.1 putative sulfate exporter family transporter [Brevundimonas sp. 357]